MLGGAIKVVEGRSYGSGEFDPFNAFAVRSHDGARKAHTMRSDAMGRTSDLPLNLTADGLIWSIPARPRATTRYTAVVKDGEWREIGKYVVEGQAPMQFLEMNL